VVEKRGLKPSVVINHGNESLTRTLWVCGFIELMDSVRAIVKMGLCHIENSIVLDPFAGV
jgi:hypothetical protein